MKKLLIASILFWMVGCTTPTASTLPAAVTVIDTVYIHDTIKAPLPCTFSIVVVKTMVMAAPPFGYVTNGSILFGLAESVRGYIIYVKDCNGAIISTTVCPANKLKKYIDDIKYQLN